MCDPKANYSDDDFLDEEEDFDFDGWFEDEKERRMEQEAFYASTCTCGAWQFNSKGYAVHVADCCCGAQ